MPDESRFGTAPGLKLTETQQGTVTYTFRRLAGDAELELVMSKKGSFGRIAAWIVLLVLVAGFANSATPPNYRA